MATSSIRIPQDSLEEFCRRNHIRKLSLFGSVITGDFGPDSDVDVLVVFSEDAHLGFFKFLGLEEFLSRKLGVKVDLVTKAALKPMLKERILRETVYA